jgi:hypothetical protein
MNAMNHPHPGSADAADVLDKASGQNLRQERNDLCQELIRVKAGLHSAKVDLELLRNKLINALNKGLVIEDLGEIVNRLDDLWESIPDETARPGRTDCSTA